MNEYMSEGMYGEPRGGSPLMKFLTEQSRKIQLEYMERIGMVIDCSTKPSKDFVEYDEEFSFTPIK